MVKTRRSPSPRPAPAGGGRGTGKTVVSVVMPLFNMETVVARSVRSVLDQTCRDFELVVVDDGSTDTGPAIVRSFNDRRVRVVGQTHAGVSAARNRGIEETGSDLVAFLDADDRWHSDFLETVLRLRRRFPACAIYATRYLIESADGNPRPAVVRGLRGGDGEAMLGDYFRIAAHSDPPIHSSAVAITRRALREAGGFPVGVTAGEDLLTWARIAARHGVAYSTEPRVTYAEPPTVDARAGRLPQEPDRVADGLAALLRETEPGMRPALRRYLAHWHKMRGVIWLHCGEHRRARAEFAAAMRRAMTLRAAVLYLLTMAPRGRVGMYRALRSLLVPPGRALP